MRTGSYFPGRGTLVEETFLKGMAEGRAKGRAKGEAEGVARERVRFVLRMVDFRGIRLSPSQRVRIAECADLDLLDHWVDRVMTVTRIDELFDGGPESVAPSSSASG